MSDDNPSGLFDPYVTPSGTFRKWHSTGTIECMVNGVWRSIPEPAQAEIKRLEGIAISAIAAEREACAKIAERDFAQPGDPELDLPVDVARLTIAAAIRARGKEE